MFVPDTSRDYSDDLPTRDVVPDRLGQVPSHSELGIPIAPTQDNRSRYILYIFYIPLRCLILKAGLNSNTIIHLPLLNLGLSVGFPLTGKIFLAPIIWYQTTTIDHPSLTSSYIINPLAGKIVAGHLQALRLV